MGKQEERLKRKYVYGNVKFLKVSMAHFLFPVVVYNLPDSGGQGIRLCFYTVYLSGSSENG